MASPLDLTMIWKMVDKASPELAKLRGNVDKTVKDVEKGGEKMSSSTKWAVAAGLGVAALATGYVALVKTVINTGDEFIKMSQKTMMSVESLSALSYAAELSDVSNQTLQAGIIKLNDAMSEAADGTELYADAFAAIGVAVTDTEGSLRSTESVLMDVAERVSQLKDDGDKVNLVKAIFGKGGTELLPLLNSGKVGIAELTAEAERMGLVMTTETAKAAEQLNDDLTRLKRTVTGWGRNLVSDDIRTFAAVMKEYDNQLKETGNSDTAFVNALLVGLGRIGDGFLDLIGIQESFRMGTTRLEQTQRLLSGAYGARMDAAQKLIEAEEQLNTGYVSVADRSRYDLALQNLKDADAQLAKLHKMHQEILKVTKEREQAEAKANATSKDREAAKDAADLLEKKTKYIDALQKEFDVLSMNSYQRRIYEAESFSVQLANEKERLAFLQTAEAIARKIKAYEDDITRAQMWANAMEEVLQSEESMQQAINDSIKSLREQTEQLQLENSLYGKTNNEREVAIAQHNLEKQGYDAKTTAAQNFLGNLQKELDLKEDLARVTSLVAQTNVQKTKDLYKDLELLDKAYFDGLKDANGNTIYQMSDEEHKQAIEQLTGVVDANKKATDEITEFWRSAAEGMQQNMSGFFFDIMQGNLSNLGQSFKRTIDKMVADMLAAKAATALFGSGFGQGGSVGGLVGSFLGMLPARESGGPVSAGQAYVVGERRPEIFVPKTNGTIIPNTDQLSQQNAVNASFHITAMDSQDVLRAMDKIKRPLAEMMNGTTRAYNLGR